MTQQNRAVFDRLHELVTSQLDGDLTNQQRRELLQLLRENEGAQRLYVEIMQDATSLRWWTAGEPAYETPRDPALASGQSPARQLWPADVRMAVAAALAASVLVSIVGTILILRYATIAAPPIAMVDSNESEKPASEFSESQSLPANRIPVDVATLTRLQDIKWADDTSALGEMTRLSIGQVLRLTAGDAEIFFDHAVQLVLRGPTCLEIRSSTEVFSPYGVISARVGEAGRGFSIETPMGRITDLGTEFAVAIGDRGATDVAVFRGEIDLAFGDHVRELRPAGRRRLIQGQALRLDADGSMRRLVAIDNARFPSVRGGFTAQSPRSTIFTDVYDNIRDGEGAKFYRIVPGGLREDALAYVDRQHEWNGIDSSGIPDMLVGADYIMPFNEDKYLPTLEVTLAIGRPATLFIFLSDIARVPDWLAADFVDTGTIIGLDESGEYTDAGYRLAEGAGVEVDTQFSVWKREILAAPTTIKLGSVKQGKRGWGFCMYGIAAVPLEAPVVSKPQRSHILESIR